VLGSGWSFLVTSGRLWYAESMLRNRSWSPYLVGALIGILSWFAFATADHPLGITTAFENTAALTTGGGPPAFAEHRAQEGKPARIDWEWMLVVGVFVGAFASSSLSGDRTRQAVPPLWRQRFGSSPGLRLGVAFLAGAVMMLGARIAGGCTSGHAISGNLQLSVASLIFTAVFFPVAIFTAWVMYRSRHRA